MFDLDTLAPLPILTGLAGGLALFLFGLDLMSGALKSTAGHRMKRLLARLTTNRFKAAFAGAFVTAVIQSSSVTTVLVVGFVSAGLMTLQQSVGVIMGANVGTTITAQIIAFKVSRYALLLIALGFGLQFLARRDRLRHYGTALLGLGLIFFGMDLMSGATRPLQDYPPFIEAMRRMDHPLLGILASAAFTALVQSSSATTGVIIALALQGFVTLEAGIALIFGANIGTCVTALLAAIGKPRAAVQAALVHVLFNVLGVLIWLGFIDQLAWIVRAISPAAEGLTGAARLAAETPRQIANAHTVFNVANLLIFIGFTRPIAWLAQRLVPERAAPAGAGVTPRYLDDILLDTPMLALDRVRMELRRLGERAAEMVERSLPVALHGDEDDLRALARLDDEIDALHEAVVAYLGRLSRQHLGAAESHQFHVYLTAANLIESIGDMIETNIVRAGWERLHNDLHVSPATEEALGRLHGKVVWAVQRALEALDASDAGAARAVIDAKEEINRLAEAAEHHLALRLAAPEAHRLPLFRLESELIEYFKRVYYFAKRIAKLLTEPPENHAPDPRSRDAAPAHQPDPSGSVATTPRPPAAAVRRRP